MYNVVKFCPIVWILFKTITDRYINKSLTCDILSRAIYNIQYTPIKLSNNIACVMWNDKFNACIESWNIIVTCFHVLVITIRNIFTTVRYINIYLYNINQAYQSCILPYSMRVSLTIKCMYSKIQPYSPSVYHVLCLSHYW